VFDASADGDHFEYLEVLSIFFLIQIEGGCQVKGVQFSKLRSGKGGANNNRIVVKERTCLYAELLPPHP
jgi:hypothetical protein